MSLVNDALKRANRSLKQPNPSSQPGVGMRPVAEADGPGMWRMIMVPLLLVGLVAAVGVFWWQWQHPQSKPAVEVALTSAPALTASASQESPATKPAPSPVPVVRDPASYAPGTVVVVTPVPPAATVVAKPSASVVAKHPVPSVRDTNQPPPTFPAIKIQAIYYRLSGPSAIVNGQTVFVGNEVSGAKVVRIERQSITFEFNGFKKTFDMFLR